MSQSRLPPGDETPPPDFNEAAYLAAFPKIAENIRGGHLKSAYDHYLRKGAAEQRLEQPRYRKALADQMLLARLSGPQAAAAPARPGAQPAEPHPASGAPGLLGGVDALMVAQGGLCLAVGWADDRGTRLAELRLLLPDGRAVATSDIARCTRPDEAAMIGCKPNTLIGFYAVIDLQQDAPPPPGTRLQLCCGETTAEHAVRPHLVAADTLRDAVFEVLATTRHAGEQYGEAFVQLDGGLGDVLLAVNRRLSRGIAGLAHVERYGNQAGPWCASIVVCLYGRPEYLFLQAALFSTAPGARDYEYVYVCNSPELTETLQREARIAAQLYGLSITLVFLTGNAGFGAANNAAVAVARTGRILIANPDVLPRDAGWAARHAGLLDGLPPDQTRLFGAPLFYDDGSLMHGGMFFDTDIALVVHADGIRRRPLLRVEHYGKGAPPDTPLYARSRVVPAVTGAFVSVDRAWFERLGGFSEDYVFGHYEDADLCLKAWRAGGQVWLHPLPLWHLEGKGSNRLPTHEGGSLINRWHFTRLWLDTVQDGFGGPTPARLAS